MSMHGARRSAAWHAILRVAYAWLRLMDPLLRLGWQTGGLGITSRLCVRGRRSGRSRCVLIGLLRVEGRWYVGHPNGEVAWTRNLAEDASATIQPWHAAPVTVRAIPIDPGAERTAVIVATAHQQPFPANLLYRAARRHIIAVGVYFRLEATG